ncbi:MAG TPA: helix-turn-helix transcriptional regulator [Dehalococcoidia bacterium]|nr:helix-turn-helix transcriptional regulator [Dehalococcoidia bacterium]
MTSSEAFAAWLRARLSALSLEPNELARRLRLNRSSVSRWLLGRSRPSPANLRMLAEALDEPLAVLYRLAGYPADLGELSELTADEVELIANYRRLSPEQKRMLQAAARAGI